MDVTITARHCEVSNGLRERTLKRVNALSRFDGAASSADVIFDIDHGVHRAEVRLFTSGGHTSVAHGSGDSLQAAISQAIDRLSRQLRRRRDRVQQRRRQNEVLQPAEGA